MTCSFKCKNLLRTKALVVKCQQCNKLFTKTAAAIKNTKNNFCCCSCAATWNNAHKTKGTRISKLEIWLQEKLKIEFPNLEIEFNQKTAINSELDIYVPSLNLAFELNGIFHYEPIYGPKKLSQIQNNDHRKFQAAIEAKIELCIIDTSSQTYFKPKSSTRFFNIIADLIRKKLSLSPKQTPNR